MNIQWPDVIGNIIVPGFVDEEEITIDWDPNAMLFERDPDKVQEFLQRSSESLKRNIALSLQAFKSRLEFPGSWFTKN